MFAKSPLLWLFSGPAWPLKVVVVVVVPLALVGGTIAAYPWAALFLLPPLIALLAGKPLVAMQQVFLIIVLPVLLAFLQQLALTFHAAIALHRIPAFSLRHIAAHIPVCLLYYSAPGGELWQWAGRAAALLGLLFSLKLLPWGFAMSLFFRSPRLQLANDPALGTARWASWAELRAIAKPGWPRAGDPPGTVLGKLDRKIVAFYPSEKLSNQHVLVVGASGAGKSTGYVLPNIFAAAQAGQSLVVTDPKGELVAKTGTWLEERGYTVQVFAPGQPVGSAWNPLLSVKSSNELDRLASALLQNDRGTNNSDPFFRYTEEYLLRLFLHAVRTHPELQDSDRNLITVLKKMETLDNKALTAFVQASGSQVARDSLRVYLTKLGKHDPGFGVAAKFAALRSAAPNLCPLDGVGIDFAALKQQKIALFCVLPVGTNVFESLLAAFYTILFIRLMEHPPGVAPSRGVRLLLDEFANLGAIHGFSEKLAVARSHGVDTSIVLQSIDQLDVLYGEHGRKTIINNCATLLVLGVNDLDSQSYISKMLGETAVRQYRDRHIQDNVISRRERSEDSIRRNLLNPDEVHSLGARGEGVAITSLCKLKFKRLNFYKESLYRQMSRVPFLLPPLSVAPPNEVLHSATKTENNDEWF